MKKLCKVCNEEQVYGDGKLTNDMCLNCYNEIKYYDREADINSEYDYHEGLGVV